METGSDSLPQRLPELLPERAWWRPGQPIGIELRGDTVPGELTVLRLGDPVLTRRHDGGRIELEGLPSGGYGIELRSGGRLVARTAIDVRASGRERLRYGFVASYPPERDPAGLSDTVRRLHLTAVQCYDWAYRHADLLGGGEEYRDALDQPISLATVRRLVAAVQDAGADALGYAAVYAVGPEEWPQWRHDALLQPDGRSPYGLGDFLFLVDPGAPDWLAHLRSQLRSAVEEVGFAGFHLDQYGYPKRARRADGAPIDVAESFAQMLAALRQELPGERLVFNQVNDFPTWRLARAAQDAVYIEPWAPQDSLGELAATVTRARLLGGDRPVVLAAYQQVYDRSGADAADRATALTMAALASHGATQLLAGEADRILVDPYYVRNHAAEATTLGMLRRWYDFLVEHDELLLAPGIADVTAAYAGGYNDDCDVTFDAAEVEGEAVAGTVWRRITAAGDRLVVHLINLLGQPDTAWDEPRAPFGNPGPGRIRVRRSGESLPRIRAADPDGDGTLIDLEVRAEGMHAIAELPELRAWQLVLIEFGDDEDGPGRGMAA